MVLVLRPGAEALPATLLVAVPHLLVFAGNVALQVVLPVCGVVAMGTVVKPSRLPSLPLVDGGFLVPLGVGRNVGGAVHGNEDSRDRGR